MGFKLYLQYSMKVYDSRTTFENEANLLSKDFGWVVDSWHIDYQSGRYMYFVLYKKEV